VRKAAQALKLRTDASARFEQGLSPELCAYAMQQAVNLIAAIAGGEVAGFVDVYPQKQQEAFVSVTTEKINRILGTSLTGADVADVFVRLGFAYKEQYGVFEVKVPFERLDLTIAEDLVEEVGRIVGYDQVPAVPLPPFENKIETNPNFYAAEKAREELAAQGYSEVFTSVFAESGQRAVANKIGGERPYLRDSLLPGLADALKKNVPNKDLLGLKEIKLFEIGPVWKGGQEAVMVGTISEKGAAQENLLEPLPATQYDELPLSQTGRYQAFSRYPYIVRDVAMWTPAATDDAAVLEQIKKEAGELAVAVRLFDRFEKEGKTSLAYRIIFQSFERTLTEVEVNAIMDKVSQKLKDQGFEIR
jgi:phenylalanyl-tRNA synthetase beta subunit